MEVLLNKMENYLLHLYSVSRKRHKRAMRLLKVRAWYEW
jgi:hypothetical protein